MDVLVGQSNITNKSRPHLNHGRKISFNDKNPREKKWAKKKDDQHENMEIPKEYLT